ncbi:MAG: hypothetical protein HZB51_08450 [Chloroflexi bacterium]|nr:hypothetical protein [Chloroflexota bacterium]
MAEPFVPSLPQTRVFPMGRIKRERMLPVRGSVLVQNGGRVGSLDVVAKADTLGHLRPIPLARYLHTTEADLSKYLVRNTGDPVQQRDLIASRPELFGALRRVYRAPAAGRIAALQGAWLTLDLADKPFELPALYRGTIVNVVQRLGVVIEATGALAQGVWGAGGECYGVLKKMVNAPDQILEESKVDLSARGVILVAGGITEAALARAAQERAAGIVVGGLPPRLREVVKALNLPTLVTDGFGATAMSAPFYELLSSHDGDEAIVNTFGGSPSTTRPEVFIPLLATGGDASIAPRPLIAQVGATIRVIGGKHLGATGKIVNIPTMARNLESGISAWGAEIELGSGDRIFEPWENLELIG